MYFIFIKEDDFVNNFITCPNCGFQYLPGEIYDPKHFLGQPKDIVRNNIGEVLGYEGIMMDLEETYTCENCNKEMKISAKVSFSIDVEKVTKNETTPEITKTSLF